MTVRPRKLNGFKRSIHFLCLLSDSFCAEVRVSAPVSILKQLGISLKMIIVWLQENV